MEISLQVAKAPEREGEVKKEDILMTCAFTMVSLDPNTKNPVAIAPLKVDTPEERRLFDLGEKNYNAKKALAKTTLRKQTPNDQESDLIHAMWLKQLEFHGKICLAQIEYIKLVLCDDVFNGVDGCGLTVARSKCAIPKARQCRVHG